MMPTLFWGKYIYMFVNIVLIWYDIDDDEEFELHASMYWLLFTFFRKKYFL